MTKLFTLPHKQKLWLRKFAKQNSIKPDIRALSGILYLLRTGCQWRMIPPCHGKWKTLYQKFRAWSASHWFSELQKRLIRQIRQKTCRKRSISTIIIDSQSVKCGLARSAKGVDGAKRIKGIKRHIAVDSNGLPLGIIVTKANAHDSKAACRLLPRILAKLPSIAIIKADNGYRGRLISNINDLFAKTLVCTKSNYGTSEFIPFNGRWVVERTEAWMDNFRRLTRNYEQHLKTAEAMAQLASIAILLNKL